MNLSDFFESVKNENFCKSIKENVKILPKTTFKIGGIAELFFEPENIEDFCKILSVCVKNNFKYFILGGGSNIVFTDKIFEGIVISTSSLKKIEKVSSNSEKTLISCECGSSMASFVNYATKNDLWGVQQFSGLPGSVGGAVFMNARCFDKEISEIFTKASYFDLNDFSIKNIEFNKSDWEYKKSPFQNKNKIILTTVFELQQKDKIFHSELEAENKKFVNERKSKGHFDFPSAGSVFKNNRKFGSPSGKIIDSCGLKGKKIGNAQIAPFHGNFIINTGNATFDDVKNLVEFTVENVKKQTGFELENEIIFVE